MGKIAGSRSTSDSGVDREFQVTIELAGYPVAMVHNNSVPPYIDNDVRCVSGPSGYGDSFDAIGTVLVNRACNA
jgi:hypothetical protein